MTAPDSISRVRAVARFTTMAGMRAPVFSFACLVLSEDRMESWELIAREKIRETLARYAHYADTGGFTAMVELFTEDGVLEIDGQPRLEGRAAIEAFLNRTKATRSAASEDPYIRHHLSSVTIDIDSPDEAAAASYFLAITERGPDHWGRYRDLLKKVGDRWLFRHRRVRVDRQKA